MPSDARQRDVTRNRDGIPIHGPEGFEGMRVAGRLAAEVLDKAVDMVRPGVSTLSINDAIHQLVLDAGAISATIGYRGYQHASCISLNHEVCHGIPRADKILRDGDILNIDVTVIVDGWYGDNSRMFVAGAPTRKAERLIDVTHDALMLGIETVKPGARISDIGEAIQKFANKHRMSVVRGFSGHGLGRSFHDKPEVHHFRQRTPGAVLEPGMFFTIEPMINLGGHDTKILSDGWTAVTRDKQLSAQFEHSVGVTEDGVEIFTLSPAGLFHPTWPRAKSSAA